MMNNYHAHALCQALMLEGFSKVEESRIEHRLTKLVRCSGPEYAIAVLKILKQHTINNLMEPTPYRFEPGEISIKWDHKSNRPKGELGIFYKKFPKPHKRLRAIGAAIASITLETISKQQLDKFMSGVVSKSVTPDGMSIDIPEGFLVSLERHLSNEWKAKEPFSALEMTATVVPEGHENRNIANYKRKLSECLANKEDKRMKRLGRLSREFSESYAALDEATTTQFYLAPQRSSDYWTSMALGSGNGSIRIPRKVRNKPIESRDYNRFDYKGNWPDSLKPLIGTVGALQQPGGKLRTVVNVNRFVNSSLEPYAKALRKTFYGQPNISVLDQQEGFMWAQKKLKDGFFMVSVDLTSATDKLDFRVFTRALKADPERFPLVAKTAEYFEYLASCPLSVPDLGGNEVQFVTGQPLGMAGSFQTLSVMNFFAGFQASVDSGVDPSNAFRIVGDDFVCDSRIAEAYDRIIRSWSGETNVSKALSSDKYVEFCSHLITRDCVYKVKPHYHPSSNHIWSNAEKSTVKATDKWYRLNKSDKELLDYVASTSDHRFNNLSDIRGSKRLTSDDRMIVATAKAIWTSLSEVGNEPDIFTISRQTIDYARASHPELDDPKGKPRQLSRRVYSTLPDGSEETLAPARGNIHLDEGAFPTVVTRYNRHTDRHEAKVSGRDIRKNARANAQTTKKIVQDLVEGKPSTLPLPHHKGVEVSTTSIVVQAMDDISHSSAYSADKRIQRRSERLERFMEKKRSPFDRLTEEDQSPSPNEMMQAHKAETLDNRGTAIELANLDIIKNIAEEVEEDPVLTYEDLADIELDGHNIVR